MSDTLINLVVVAIVVGTVVLALYTYLTNKKRQAGSQFNETSFRAWMTAQNFAPDYVSWFGGTGLAFKNEEGRFVLQSKGAVRFYPLADITAVKTYQTTASSRPLGAAPGVVEVKQFQLFNIDLSLKNIAEPVRILVKDENDMQQWEQRLKTAANL